MAKLARLGLVLAAALALSAPASAAQQGEASFYGQWHDRKPMANGRPFDQYGPTVAHRTLPLGTRVRIRNLDTGRLAVAEVTDRGPYAKGRVMDVSRGIARRLGMEKAGVAQVRITVIHRPSKPHHQRRLGRRQRL